MANVNNTHQTRRQMDELRTRVIAGVDRFIPPRVRGGDPDVLRRARLVVALAAVLIAAALFYALALYLVSSTAIAAALIMAIIAALVDLYVMRRTGSPLAAGNLLTLAFFCVLTALACRLGGHGSLTLPWYAAVPVVALSTAGRRSALLWLAVTASSLGAFHALDHIGYSFPNDLTPQHYKLICLLSWIGLIVLVLSLALLYEAAKVQMLRQLQQGRAALEDGRKQMLSMFDSMGGGIYVADPHTYELLYMNDLARRRFGNRIGQPCYRVLQNRDTPCPFCTNDRIFGENANQVYVWEFQNEIDQRWYRCIDRAVRWSDGRMVRFELAVDIHDCKEHEALLEQARKTAESHAQRATEAMDDMKRMNAVMMGRELRVLGMKEEVNDLLAELGRTRKYEHV